MPEIGSVVLPGDILRDLKTSESSGKTVLGPGLRIDSQNTDDEGDQIIVCKPGILRHREPNVYWVDSHQKRYIPTKGDSIIGIVTIKSGDNYRVDIGSSEPASLSYLAFEGATKRNRPDVKIGDLVYARIVVANKDIEPELVCIDSVGRSSGLGIIRDGGFLLHCSLNLVRKILSKDCPLLKLLGNTLPYETAIGMNGRIWIKGRSTLETITIINAIDRSEFMSNDQIKIMVKQTVDRLSGF